MSRLEEIKARAEKAIVELVSLLPEQISYAEYVGANSCYGSGPYIWTDPEPYVMDEAAKLIKELLAEVERLWEYGDLPLTNVCQSTDACDRLRWLLSQAERVVRVEDEDRAAVDRACRLMAGIDNGFDRERG